MESKTKNIQTFNNIKMMIDNAFGNKYNITENDIKELTEGFFNVAYDIKLDENKSVILKIAPQNNIEVLQYEKNMMSAEVEILRLVKSTEDIPVPEIYYYDDTHNLCDANYFIMDKVPGISYASSKDKLPIEVINKIDYKLGEYNRKINSIEGNYFGYPGREEFQGNNWRDVFIKLVSAVLEDGKAKGVNIDVDYTKILEYVKVNSKVLEAVTKPKLVHWDLWDGNVILHNQEISGIIDFERALFADPLMEFNFKDIEASQAGTCFLRGYRKINFTAEEMQRRKLYNIYLYLVMTIECAYRNYADNGQYFWAKMMLMEELKNK